MCESVRSVLAHVGYGEHFCSGVVSLGALANGPPNSQQALGLGISGLSSLMMSSALAYAQSQQPSFIIK